MAEYLYLDIETLPTSDPEVVADIEKSITPPGNISKPETIAAWVAEKKPPLVTEAVAKTGLNGALGSICCIAWAWNDKDIQCRFAVDGERECLDIALRHINDERPEGYQRPVIVGHFVAGFDIRFIWQRCFVLGVRPPASIPRDPKPWSDEVHDTMTMWAGARDSISLDNLCKALGLPGKGNITGADVARLWAAGEDQAVAEYCMADVERVRAVHRKMLLAFGEAA